MTMRAAREQQTPLAGRVLIAAISLALGFVAGAAISEPWRSSDPSSPRVIDLGLDTSGAPEGYPLAPSYGTGHAPMTAEEAVAQHEALIEAWLSGSG